MRHDYIEANAKTVGATKALGKPVDALNLHDLIRECLRRAKIRELD